MSDNRFDTSQMSQELQGIDFVETQEDDELQTTDSLRVFLNEIDIMFDVEKIDAALYHRSISTATIQSHIITALKNYSVTQHLFEWSVNCFITKSATQMNDLLVCDVTITKRYDLPEDFRPITKRFII
jgi:hypothetical protein